MLTIQPFEFNPFMENTYVLFDETNECVIIDPGCYDKTEQETLKKFISTNNLIVKYLINTHCHIDHVLGNAFIKRTFNIGLTIHEIEKPYLNAVKSYASNYGFVQYESTEPDYFITEADRITFGNQSLTILFVPGHSPGHIALYHEASKSLIGGDVLFERSIGRTDLPGGDFETLIHSIQKKLFTLPNDVIVYPGHGGTTTIGEEKMHNPFCAI